MSIPTMAVNLSINANLGRFSLKSFKKHIMKDCGEDLLVDISEILFNELAFYKLMQELDGGAKAKFFNREQKYRMENAAARNSRNQEDNPGETGRNTTAEVKDEDEVVVENENAEDQEDEGSSSSSSEWQVVDEATEDKPEDMISREQLEQDEETLGRARDDAMAEEFDEPRDEAEAADTESSQCIKIVELSMSESRPLARNGSDEESEVDIAGEVNGENAEGAVWNGNMNGSQDHNMLPSQMAAANGADAAAEEEEGEEDQDDDLPTKFTGLTEADLQVKIAEEQSRNDGISGIVVSMDNGDELAGDPNAIAEPEGSALVNGDAHDEPEN